MKPDVSRPFVPGLSSTLGPEKSFNQGVPRSSRGWVTTLKSRVCMICADSFFFRFWGISKSIYLAFCEFSAIIQQETVRAWRNGRRTRLRIWRGNSWRFKSSRPHQSNTNKSWGKDSMFLRIREFVKNYCRP